MNIADLPGDRERRTGLSAGGFLTVDLPGPFALQPELFYVQKGATTEETGRTRTGNLIGIERAIETAYLELVALGKVQVPGVPLVTPTVGIGPTLGANLLSDAGVTARVFDQFGGEEEVDPGQLGLEPPELDARSPEVGLLVSVGTGAEVAGVTVSVSGRYRLGLTDVSNGDVGSEQQGLGLGTNRGFSVTVGLTF